MVQSSLQESSEEKADIYPAEKAYENENKKGIPERRKAMPICNDRPIPCYAHLLMCSLGIFSGLYLDGMLAHNSIKAYM